MPDTKSMSKYSKMLDEIASRYPELEEAVTEFEGALMGSMEPGSEEEAAPAPGDEDAAMPFPPKRKGPPAPDEEEPEDESGEPPYTF